MTGTTRANPPETLVTKFIQWAGNASSDDLHIVEGIAILLGPNIHLLEFIFHPTMAKLRHPAIILLENSRGLSHGEKLLIQISIDLWNGEGHASLSEILGTWDSDNMVSFIKAICHIKTISAAYNG